MSSASLSVSALEMVSLSCIKARRNFLSMSSVHAFGAIVLEMARLSKMCTDDDDTVED